jgi:murein DD-endopeptidase MepM/ murein hydrolase activator NlpD
MELKNNSFLSARLLSLYVIFSLTISLLILNYYSNYKTSSVPLITSIKSSITSNTNFVTDAYHWLIEGYSYNIPSKDRVDVKITKGDTLMDILGNNGVDKSTAQKITTALKQLYNLKRLSIGQQITFIFSKKPIIDSDNHESTEYVLDLFKINVDHYKDIEISLNANNEYVAKEVAIPLKRYVVRAQGIIENSLLATANSLSIPNDALMEIIKAYSYDVDFQRDIKIGDEINVVFERYYTDKGEYSHDGEILFSSLKLSDKNFTLYKYQNSNGDIQYYSSEGNSIRKDLLKTPINIVRISSNYGVRKHPVHGYSKMHKGVDFAAPIGTPIFAAGSGSIEEIGRKGGYGNYVKIRHSNGYSTAYGHASSFAKNLKKGSQVKQGDIIAYVGSTGAATGPHLHFEVLVNNQQVNPMKVKLDPGVKLNASELARFKTFQTKLDNMIDTIPNLTEIAMENNFKY